MAGEWRTAKFDRFRERAKVAVRGALHRRNLDLVRNPYPVRLVTALRWMQINTVLDVGANIGQYGSAIRASGFEGRIISCEPLAEAFAGLKRHTRTDSSWMIAHTAVGAAPAMLTINISENSYSSSMLPMTDAHLSAAPRSRIVGTQQVRATTVVDLVREHGIDPARCLLKVDTQGYEGQVLDGAYGLLGDFAAVQLELSFVPLYEGQALFDMLVARLDTAGYEIFSFEPGISDPISGKLLQVDGLFVSRDLLPASSGPSGKVRSN